MFYDWSVEKAIVDLQSDLKDFQFIIHRVLTIQAQNNDLGAALQTLLKLALHYKINITSVTQVTVNFEWFSFRFSSKLFQDIFSFIHSPEFLFKPND